MFLCIICYQFYPLVKRTKEMHAVLTDVTSVTRVHKLSVIVNKHGDLRTISCVPCGPLHWDDNVTANDVTTQSKRKLSETCDCYEDEYTRVGMPQNFSV